MSRLFFFLGIFIYVQSAFADELTSTPAAGGISVSAPSGIPMLSHEGKARVRAFGRNGVSLNFYANSECYQRGVFGLTEGESVSGGFSAAWFSFIGAAKNNTIGIPETNSTMHINDRGGLIFNRVYFREYTVIADEPLTVAAGEQGCGFLGVTFKPESNRDYEFELEIQGNSCKLRASELIGETSPAMLRPLRNYLPASRCASSLDHEKNTP
jgi:hypothetical protein